MPDIAVVCDKEGRAASLFDGTAVVVYQKSADGWSAAESYPLELDISQGIGAVRKSVTAMIASLNGLKTIAGREMSGVPYHMLDAAGFAVFEIGGYPEEFLDHITSELEMELQAKNAAEEGPASPEPVDGEGRYRLDLTELLQRRPDLSSKKVLVPFLENTPFYELEVMCSHIPPWFSRNLSSMQLEFKSEMLSSASYRVTITHQTCKG